jgi:hypothetical protein
MAESFDESPDEIGVIMPSDLTAASILERLFRIAHRAGASGNSFHVEVLDIPMEAGSTSVRIELAEGGNRWQMMIAPVLENGVPVLLFTAEGTA